MTKELDEIFYDALTNDEAIMTLCEGRIFSTCVEVAPVDDDNTPVPYIIITDDPFSNDIETKDDIWEGDTDRVAASVQISANSPYELRMIRRMVRKAIAEHITQVQERIPFLYSLNNDGISWDWTKPCYYDALHYSADMQVDLSNE